MPTETVKKTRAQSKTGAGKSRTNAQLLARIAELEAQAGGKPAKAVAPSGDDKVTVLNLSKNPLTIVPVDGGPVVSIGPGPVKDQTIPGEYEVSAVVKRKDVSGVVWDAMAQNREIEIRSAP